ncbi:hypothetical protein [Elongatibacter sediminis]|uniref:Sulfotransferase domain-containing protein n=1 Tax=Elongatibacter sediminis TaxID=3119006 RepID=A0AAW9REC6_9GAMM
MELHLHLGAHKTASTHFQRVMLCNRRLYEHAAHYVPLNEFRANVTRASRFLDPRCRGAVDDYLVRLGSTQSRSLIISEENILGEANDAYRARRLYRHLGKRAGRLKEFVSGFEDTTIWIAVRSMDEFIPALYCEALLHFRIRRFGRFFSGRYEQSWVPVILTLRDIFPQTKIIVIPYETYRETLPHWVAAMTGVDTGWDLLSGERPRESANHFAVKIMGVVHPFCSRARAPVVLEALSRHFYRKGIGGKFSPFGESVRNRLRSRYKSDLQEIESLGEGISLFQKSSRSRNNAGF